ncbi:MAG TPA: carboxylesterase/lipase family protein [Xanthomonadales bacterium]|nr:carboxylesterase/lipase family protein [Xanthomonadales bacterium]
MRVTRRTLLLGLGAGVVANALPLSAAPRHAVATTRAGRVRGVVEHGVHVFRGVPYGADTAARRFLPPRAPAPWKGTRDALAFGHASPQRGDVGATGEDCLVLNAWTPALRDGAKRPVMVYVHGGEFSTGSGSAAILDGTRLCRRGDVVVVTLNHRLNAFGHLYLGRLRGRDYAASGNAGLLDLVLALEWVHDHAAEFGGDPGNVTVFGQSGGGAKIATLMAMPAARGLFHRAATMSGQQVTASGPRSAALRAEALLRALGIPSADVGKLDAVPVADLVAATQAPDATIAGRPLYFGPVLDDAALPRHPFYPDAPPQSASIPMLIGNTRDETRAWLRDEPGIETLAWDDLPVRLLPQLHVDIPPERVVAAYRRIYPSYSPTDVYFAATTAGRSWRGAVIEAELRAAQRRNTWTYQLDYRSPVDGGKYGAMHAMDIPLVFDNVAMPGSLHVAAAQPVADAMSDAFVEFARTGRCRWPPYDVARRATMVFDAASHVVDDPRRGERELFAQVPYIQRGTY